MKTQLLSMVLVLVTFFSAFANVEVAIWHKLEIGFVSSKSYQNPIYEIRKLSLSFTSPCSTYLENCKSKLILK